MDDCGCGRSPSGKCIGWHSLSEEEYQEKLKEYEENNPNFPPDNLGNKYKNNSYSIKSLSWPVSLSQSPVVTIPSLMHFFRV